MTRFAAPLSACTLRLTASNCGHSQQLDHQVSTQKYVNRLMITYQAKEKVKRKVSLCNLLTNCIANHVDRKRPLYTSPPLSEPSCYKSCCKHELRPAGACLPQCSQQSLFMRYQYFSNSICIDYDGIRSRSKELECGSTILCIIYQTKLNKIIVFHINVLLDGLMWLNPIIKSSSFFLSY